MRVIELSDAVGAEHRALDAILRRLSSEQMRQKVAGTWTVKDVIGHIAAYEGVQRIDLAAGLGRGKEQPVYFDSYETWNEEQYNVRRDWTPGRVTAELHENSARYLSLIKSLHEEDLIKHIRFPWGGQGTVHQMIVEGLDHAREHREQLAAAVGQTAYTGDTRKL